MKENPGVSKRRKKKEGVSRRRGSPVKQRETAHTIVYKKRK